MPTSAKPRESWAQKEVGRVVNRKWKRREKTGGQSSVIPAVLAKLWKPNQPPAKYDPPSFIEQAAARGWQAGFYSFPGETKERLYYNPGLCEFNGMRWLFARRVAPSNSTLRTVSNIEAWLLVNNNPLSSATVRIDRNHPREEFEDARAIVYRGRIMLSCCNFIRDGRTHAHQVYAFLDRNFSGPTPFHPVFGKNILSLSRQKGHEKNWVYFENGGHLWFIYGSDGNHHVCRIIGDRVWEVKSTKIQGVPDWPYGEIRGGTPPIFHDGKYLTFFHSSTEIGVVKRYYMGAYEFEAEPPFRVTRRTPMALLAGSRFDPMGVERKLVVFPGGAIRDGNDWLVVFGCNDARCGWARIPIEDLEGMLK